MPDDPTNPEFFYGNTSVLRQGDPVRSEIARAILTGLRMGLGFALFLIIVVGLVLVWLHVDTATRRWFSLFSVIAGPLLGIAVTTLYYFADSKMGYFGVSDDVISFRTPLRYFTIPLEKIFGAGPELHGENNWLRICYLANNKCGFKSFLCNFRFYEAESGPIMDEKLDGLDGNQVARLAIIAHIRHRLKNQMPVASIPAFRFEATSDIRCAASGSIYMTVKGYFRCDGRFLEIQEEVGEVAFEVADGLHTAGEKQSALCPVRSGHHQFEVTNVADVQINVDPVIDSSSNSGLMIYLKEPEGEFIRLFVNFYSNSREIKKYCRCLPTLFPFYDDTEFWFGGDEYYGDFKKIAPET